MANKRGHLTAHAFQPSYQCAVCTKNLANKDSLTQHLIRHTDVKPFVCRDSGCKKRFRTKQELQFHTDVLRIRTPRHSCCHCLTSFINKKDLANHVAAHIGQRKFGCRFCSASYESRISLGLHTRKQHNNGVRLPFRCSSCELAFASRSGRAAHCAMAHEYSQPNRQRFGCAVCGAGYSNLDSLRIHLTAHYSSTACRCAVCGKAQLRKRDLYKHIKAVHLKERPFLCDRCPVRFASVGDLNRHIRRHAEENPFACHDCPARFATKQSLAGHTCAHSLTFHCTDCGKRFLFSRSLVQHTQVHHPKPEASKYGCATCGRHFPWKSRLHSHCIGHGPH